ncbi:MAG TPA: COX15/CtaA family protein [Terriglobales bacterium]|nr:COX15/CtaA family protein [Terriglobales bacterium]
MINKRMTLNGFSTPYNRSLHRLALFLACWTFLLILAGALVTSNDAGLSVPDWPTSFGSLYKIPHMVGGVRFEHTHRMIAQVAGLLTIILAIWTWRADQRPWMKYLAVGALGTVIAQGILGGLTVLFYLPPAISSAHAALAQTFFCLTVAIALFTGPRWVEEVPKVEPDARHPSLFVLALLSILVLYVQLGLGAMFRHRGMSWWPHAANAPIVAVVLAWTAIRALSEYGRIEAVRRPAILMLGLLITQLCLGFLAFLTRIAWGHDAVQPELPMVVSTVAHVAVGALLLATVVVLAIQIWRHIPMSFAERIGHHEQRPVAA